MARNLLYNTAYRPGPAFNGKVVWVIGASSGIGQAMATLFVALGARVIVSARRQERLEELAEELGGAERCSPLSLDLNELTTLPAAVNQAVSRFDGLDAVVLAAGVSQRAYAFETDDAVFHRIMNVNFRGPAVIARHAVPYLRDREEGTIIVLSSIAATIVTPYRSAYSASKRALEGYFTALRMELNREKSRVNVVIATPGFVRTDISRSALTGSGTAHSELDENQRRGMTADRCARKIIQAVLSGRREVRVGLGVRGWTVFFLRSVAPRFLERRLTRGSVT